MPNNNGTGPMGQGAGTGKGMGNCGAGSRGMRRGCCGRFMQGFGRFLGTKDELPNLEEQEKMLLNNLEVVRSQKEELKSQK